MVILDTVDWLIWIWINYSVEYTATRYDAAMHVKFLTICIVLGTTRPYYLSFS